MELASSPLPFSLGNYGDQLSCPVCGDEYVHIDSATSSGNKDDYSSGWVRGDTVTINFYCESNHTFSLEFGFHKGNTYLRVNPEYGFRS